MKKILLFLMAVPLVANAEMTKKEALELIEKAKKITFEQATIRDLDKLDEAKGVLEKAHISYANGQCCLNTHPVQQCSSGSKFCNMVPSTGQCSLASDYCM